MRVATILAHQDDEMFCLGTLLRCRERGDEITFLTLTDGARGMVQAPEMPLDEAARIRQAEMEALAAEIGAGYVNLAEPDEFLFDSEALRLRLTEALRQIRPDVIFTHQDEDYNADHTTTSTICRQAAMFSGIASIRTASQALKAVPAIFTIEPHGPARFHPSHYVDISAVHDEKCRLMKRHVSQDAAFRAFTGYGLESMFGKVSAFRGLQTGCEHAEAFCTMSLRGSVKPFSVLP